MGDNIESATFLPNAGNSFRRGKRRGSEIPQMAPGLALLNHTYIYGTRIAVEAGKMALAVVGEVCRAFLTRGLWAAIRWKDAQTMLAKMDQATEEYENE